MVDYTFLKNEEINEESDLINEESDFDENEEDDEESDFDENEADEILKRDKHLKSRPAVVKTEMLSKADEEILSQWNKRHEACMQKEMKACLGTKEWGLTWEICRGYSKIICEAKDPCPGKPIFDKKKFLPLGKKWKTNQMKLRFEETHFYEGRKIWLKWEEEFLRK